MSAGLNVWIRELVIQQIEAVLDDIPPHAAKLGALGDRSIVEAVASIAQRFTFPLVVDPVMISKHGAPLMAEEGTNRRSRTHRASWRFFSLPNLHEAAALTGLAVQNVEDMIRAGERLQSCGATNVLVKGGHLEGDAIDVLLTEHGVHEFPSERVDTPHTHGTGCTYSAAITAALAKGDLIVEAVRKAKEFITRAIRTNPALGHGAGPVNHHA